MGVHKKRIGRKLLNIDSLVAEGVGVDVLEGVAVEEAVGPGCPGQAVWYHYINKILFLLKKTGFP